MEFSLAISDDFIKSKLLKQTEEIEKLETNIAKQNEIIEMLKNKLDKVKSEQFICMQVIEYKNLDEIITYMNIPKNINKLEFGVNIQCRYAPLLTYNFFEKELCIQYQDNFLNEKKDNNPYYIFDYKTIIVKPDYYYVYDIKNILFFIDEYLKKRSNHMVDLIETTYNEEMIPILLAHTNYKKLKIKYDKEFDDTKIKTHLKANNIEFSYII